MRLMQVNLFEEATRRYARGDIPHSAAGVATLLLADALAGENAWVPALGQDTVLQATPLGQSVLCSLGRHERYSLVFGVAASASSGTKLWESLRSMPRTVLPNLTKFAMPQLPWCAAVDLIGPEEFATPKTEWVKDFIIGVSFAWLDLQGWPDEAATHSHTSRGRQTFSAESSSSLASPSDQQLPR